jgi:hypothetical protein
VHDELIFEAAPGELDALTALVKAEMGGATSLRVPLEVSTGTGRSWAEAAHLSSGGTTPRTPRVARAIGRSAGGERLPPVGRRAGYQ